jgi:predicted PurR-regulated permease PerM
LRAFIQFSMSHPSRTAEPEAPLAPVAEPVLEGAPEAKPAEPKPAETRPPSFAPIRLTGTVRVVFLLSVLLLFAYFARAVVLPVLLACIAAMTLKAPVRWLGNIGLPLPLASAITVGLVVTGLALAVVNLGRPAVAWLAATPENVPRLKTKLRHLLQPAARLREAATTVGKLGTEDANNPPAQPVEVKDNHMASSVFTWTGSLLAGAGETVALLFLLLASGDLFLYKLVKAMPRLRDKKQAVEISREIQHSISTYLFSVALINLTLGAIIGLVLMVVGMPNAWMWGAVAAVANFVPYLGPVSAIAALSVAGLLEFDSIGLGLVPAAAYTALHLVEANIVTPWILGRRFALNPVLIFVTLIFLVFLWGVLGALLAVPLLVTLKVICDRISPLNFVGEVLSPQVTPEPPGEIERDGSSGRGPATGAAPPVPAIQ